jgi:uncharacterized protein (DUF1778 family)
MVFRAPYDIQYVYRLAIQTQRSLMRTAAINIRARQDERSLIDYASHLVGKSRSDFMLEAACDKAKQAMLDQVFFAMDSHQFSQFTQMLDAPVTPNLGLQRLMAIQSPWEAKSL